MKQIYQQIPEEKREKILQAAIAEFAEHGYEEASTNRIIQKASISKGLLFHYFGNKKQLFLATFDYCLDRYVGEMMERIPPLPDLPDDFFERILCLSELKYWYFLQHPEVYFFLLTAYHELSEKFPGEAEKRLSDFRDVSLHFMLEQIDRSKFREDLDLEKAVSFIYLSLKMLTRRVTEQPENALSRWKEMLNEYREMLDIFKNGVYQPGRK